MIEESLVYCCEMACTNAGFMSDDTRTSDGVAKICAADPSNCLQGILKIDKHEFDVAFDGNFLTWTKKSTSTKNIGEANISVQ